MSCVKPQSLPPIADQEAWQRRRVARQRVLAGVRQRRARNHRARTITTKGTKEGAVTGALGHRLSRSNAPTVGVL